MCGDESQLPLHLRLTDPLDIDQLPLHVSLLTMELATIRMQLTRLAEMWRAVPAVLQPPAGDLFHERPSPANE
jgi:hypothetical protein